jgi:hypothetical protein
MTDIFISYSRRDKAFVRALYEALTNLNRTAWIDWRDIAPAVEWEKTIYEGIERAKKFVFVISPDSVASKYCNDELNHAIRHHKPLVPILCRDVDLNTVRKELSVHQLISFCGEEDFSTALQKLAEVIDTDFEHARLYIRLKERAEEWKRRGCQEDFLLRGGELAEAQAWLTASALKKPEPSDLHKEYITASQEAIQQEAQRWKELYEKAEQERKRAEIAEIEALNSASHALWLAHDQLGALITCVKAGKKLLQTEAPNQIKLGTVDRLRQTLHRIQQRNQLAGHSDRVNSVMFSPDGKMIVTASSDKTVKLWSKDGRTLHTLSGHHDRIDSVAFSPDGQMIASNSGARTVKNLKRSLGITSQSIAFISVPTAGCSPLPVMTGVSNSGVRTVKNF